MHTQQVRAVIAKSAADVRNETQEQQVEPPWPVREGTAYQSGDAAHEHDADDGRSK